MRQLLIRRKRGRFLTAFVSGLLVQCLGIHLVHGQDLPAADAEPEAEADAEPENAAPAELATPDSNVELPGDEFFGEEEELEFGAVAEVKAPPREVTKRTMDREQLTRIPGTRGDALRAVDIMPGVSRTAAFSNDGAPLLRGSPNLESIVQLDGAEVPLIYHFGGLTSFFNSHLLESVDLYPGNYSARYGRAAGGVVAATVRDPKSDRFHALLDLNLIDMSALVESPVGKNTSLALAARRSNIDFFFGLFSEDANYSIDAAPVYYDYQAILAHRFNEANKMRLMFYGSHDRFEILIDESEATDPAVRGAAGGSIGFHRFQAELESRLSEKVEQNLMVSVGPSGGTQQLGELYTDFKWFDVNARAEWSIFASPQWRFDTGFDFQMFAGNGKYRGPAPAQDEGNPSNDSLASETLLSIDDNIAPIYPAVYAEAAWTPIEELMIMPAIRADYVVEGEDLTFDPRLAARYTAAENTVLKGGVGLFSQPPEYYEVMDELGNPELNPYRTIQTSAGVEQKFASFVRVDLEGFYKIWQDRVVGTEGGEPPGFVNDGKGRAYGLEFLLDVRPTERTQAFVSYTLSRSERQDLNAPWRLFDSDQTHNLQLTGNYDFGHGWLAGLRFRYVTGNPYSPVVATVYDASSDTYRGIYGDINSERLKAFHQLDVRVEKRWDLGPVGLTTYLEVINVYNAKNEEGIAYSFDFKQSEGVNGMPIFPNLGIRGEL